MSKNDKITLIKRLLSRGEVECAQVCCYDWGLNLEMLKRGGEK